MSWDTFYVVTFYFTSPANLGVFWVQYFELKMQD